MARSTYIYLVCKDDEPLGAFTVKREAYEWTVRTVFKPSQLVLKRMKDNPREHAVVGVGDKIAWDREMLANAYADKHHVFDPVSVVKSLHLITYGLDELEAAIVEKKGEME